jgi:hypothetical protein
MWNSPISVHFIVKCLEMVLKTWENFTICTPVNSAFSFLVLRKCVKLTCFLFDLAFFPVGGSVAIKCLV